GQRTRVGKQLALGLDRNAPSQFRLEAAVVDVGLGSGDGRDTRGRGGHRGLRDGVGDEARRSLLGAWVNCPEGGHPGTIESRISVYIATVPNATVVSGDLTNNVPSTSLAGDGQGKVEDRVSGRSH